MKAGLTIEELATEVMRQKDAKADYIVNTSMLAMEHCGKQRYSPAKSHGRIGPAGRKEDIPVCDLRHRAK